MKLLRDYIDWTPGGKRLWPELLLFFSRKKYLKISRTYTELQKKTKKKQAENRLIFLASSSPVDSSPLAILVRYENRLSSACFLVSSSPVDASPLAILVLVR
jgi:hypothetical protein